MSKFLILYFGVMNIFTFNAYGLTGADETLLKSAGILKNKVLRHDDTWEVKPSEIDIESVEYKEQGKSLINWSKVNHKQWLDYDHWLFQRKRRDKIPNWKFKLRQSTYSEKFGEVISCVGICEVFKGESKIKAKASSRIFEGDEFRTLENSAAWILLSEGTLVRVSAKTSLTLNEVNIAQTKHFVSLRLNHGHIKSFRRTVGKYVIKDLSETDLSFYPLKNLKANREYYSRLEYARLDSDQRQIYLTKNNLGFFTQYKTLNSFLTEELNLNKIQSSFFITTPNASVKVENGNFDIFYGINSKSYLRVKDKITDFIASDDRETKASVMLRGYLNKEIHQVELSKWYEVNPQGKEIEQSDIGEKFEVLDLLTKRIPTILLAREFMIRNKYTYLFEENLDSETLAKNFGFRLWNKNGLKEIEKREKFLFEYTRRVETTNLVSLKKVFEGRLEKFDSSFYQFTFNQYINKLKGRYNNKKLIIPELSDTEYYIWVLKYAKN